MTLRHLFAIRPDIEAINTPHRTLDAVPTGRDEEALLSRWHGSTRNIANRTCCGCLTAPRTHARGRLRSSIPWLAATPALLYVIAPKCPFCIVALLSVCGAGFGLTKLLSSIIGPLAILSAMLPIVVVGWRVRQRRRSARRHGALALGVGAAK